MIEQRTILRSLPLVASVLGRRYGVHVQIAGQTAFTDGTTINLPELPADGDEKLLPLVRGYLDHEAGHIRETDFGILQAKRLSPLTKHIWNIIEDWRVEQRLSAVFPGCKQNLQWLARHLFIEDVDEPPVSAELQILDWMLHSVRAWLVPELSAKRDVLAMSIENAFPGLVQRLQPAADVIPTRCMTSGDCLAVAKEIVDILKGYMRGLPPEPSTDASSGGQASSAKTYLQNLLKSNEASLPKDFGTILSEKVGSLCSGQKDRFSVAVVGEKFFVPLAQTDIAAIRHTTIQLRTRLQGVLQSSVSKRQRNGYFGRLNPQRLYKVAVAEPRIFSARSVSLGLNTAIHILLDTSGSMNDYRLKVATHACFVLTTALQGIKGIGVAVSAFPAKPVRNADAKQTKIQTVFPILKHKEKIHDRFVSAACGGTPMGAALWWVLQQMLPLPEKRKLILVITDGEPDYPEPVKQATQQAEVMGMEIYGVGICTQSVQQLFPGTSKVISAVDELPQAVFSLLQNALLQR